MAFGGFFNGKPKTELTPEPGSQADLERQEHLAAEQSSSAVSGDPFLEVSTVNPNTILQPPAGADDGYSVDDALATFEPAATVQLESKSESPSTGEDAVINDSAVDDAFSSSYEVRPEGQEQPAPQPEPDPVPEANPAQETPPAVAPAEPASTPASTTQPPAAPVEPKPASQPRPDPQPKSDVDVSLVMPKGYADFYVIREPTSGKICRVVGVDQYEKELANKIQKDLPVTVRDIVELQRAKSVLTQHFYRVSRDGNPLTPVPDTLDAELRSDMTTERTEVKKRIIEAKKSRKQQPSESKPQVSPQVAALTAALSKMDPGDLAALQQALGTQTPPPDAQP